MGSPSGDLYLALDQGGHASRAILFDGAGAKAAEAFAPVATLRDGQGHVEHDPEELIASLRAAVDEVCARAGGRRIVAAGLATQRSSMACWDRRSGEALSPVISWQDRRNADWLGQFAPRREWIRAHTGLVLTPHYGASKMRWCLDHLPAVARAAQDGRLAMGPLASFIAFHLLVEQPLVTDPANASRTQLWDPSTRDWSEPLLTLFGVPRAALPRCVNSRADYGTLTTPAGPVPLNVVTGDQSAVPFAFGPLDPAAAYVNAGTGAFVQRLTSGASSMMNAATPAKGIHDRLPDAPRLLASVVWSDAGGVDYMLEGTVNGAGSALEWFAAHEGADAGALLEGRETPPEPGDRPLFLNGVSGLGSPFWVDDFESRFVGEGTVAQRLLAVLESIAFLIRVNLEELRPHGAALSRIILTGGLSASDPLCRRLADVTGLTVWRSREQEATARGLAALVADLPSWPGAGGDTFRPRAGSPAASRYPAWLAAMTSAVGRRR